MSNHMHDMTKGDAIDRQLLMENFRRLADQLRGPRVTVTSPVAANTEFTVPHQLGAVPTGYAVLSKSAPCNVYTSKAADKTNVYLKCDQSAIALTLEITPGEVVTA